MIHSFSKMCPTHNEDRSAACSLPNGHPGPHEIDGEPDAPPDEEADPGEYRDRIGAAFRSGKAAGVRDGMERAASLCRPLYQDADRPSLAAGAAECMIVIRRASDALLVAPSEAKAPAPISAEECVALRKSVNNLLAMLLLVDARHADMNCAVVAFELLKRMPGPITVAVDEIMGARS